MRVRCSKGISIASYHGHHLLKGADLMSLPTIDTDKSFALELKNGLVCSILIGRHSIEC
jgi:hypothetical protein